MKSTLAARPWTRACATPWSPVRHSKPRPGTRLTHAGAVLTAPLSPSTAPSSSETQKVAIFVEPSPFSHISGMKNRFESLIKGLRESGDEVVVVVPNTGPKPPTEFFGAKILNVLGFQIPFLYPSPTLLLSLGLSARVVYQLITMRPQLIHVSSPGCLVFTAALYARLFAIPLVVSYHTHIPEYVPRYVVAWLAPILVGFQWWMTRLATRLSDLTLVTSASMKTELARNLCRDKSIDVWQRGVDTEVFNPKFRSRAMRERMTEGNPDAPLMVYVGRIGNEKNLVCIKGMLEKLPQGVRLALVGDGPQMVELKEYFKDMPVVFMGILRGQELSEAYASADIFIMPSESETLGFVVLEAMASGVAVVSVAAGGLVDILTQPGKTGHLYQPGDYDTATELVRGLIEDPEARQAMAAAGRAEVEKYGWSAATKVLREQQYSRAIRVSQSRRRFRPMAMRVGLVHRLRRLWTAIVALWMRLTNQGGDRALAAA